MDSLLFPCSQCIITPGGFESQKLSGNLVTPGPPGGTVRQANMPHSKGQHWPVGLTLRAEAYGEQYRDREKGGGVENVPLCLISSSYLRGEKKPVCLSLQERCLCLYRSAWWRLKLGAQLLSLAPGCVWLLGARPQAVSPWRMGWSDPQPLQLEPAAQQVHITQRAKYTVSLFHDKSIHSTHCDSCRRASSAPRKWNAHILFA